MSLLGKRGGAGPSRQVPVLFKPKENKMEMTKKEAAAEIKRLRSQAKDESLPQGVRNQMMDKANQIEYKFYEESSKMAKGGAVKKAAAKKAPAKAPAGKTAASKAAGTTRQSPVVAVMIGMTEKKPAKKVAKVGK